MCLQALYINQIPHLGHMFQTRKYTEENCNGSENNSVPFKTDIDDNKVLLIVVMPTLLKSLHHLVNTPPRVGKYFV